MKASPYYMAYGSKARLPSDQVCVRFDNSPENIELTLRQRHLTVKKLEKTRKQIITELNDRATARHTATENILRITIPSETYAQEIEFSDVSKEDLQNSTPNGMDRLSSGMLTRTVKFSLMTSNGHNLKAKVNGSRIKCFNSSTDDFYYTSKQLHRRDKQARKKRNESLSRR